MKRIELHTHSTFSDGTATPAELVTLAGHAGLAALALTDHDTTDGLAEARQAAATTDLEIISGCEISTNLDGRSVHVLGHGFREDDPGLQGLLAQVRRDREERNRLMLARLAELGMPLDLEAVLAYATGDIVARPHFARAMVERGYVSDIRQAFTRYLRDGGPAHVVVGRPAPVDAVAAIRAAGGASSIAHPRQIALEDDAAWEAFFSELTEAGLTGIEIDHPSQNAEQRRYFGAWAKRFDLVWTGGSDFHGAAKPHIELGRGDGTVVIPYETWVQLRAKASATAS